MAEMTADNIVEAARALYDVWFPDEICWGLQPMAVRFLFIQRAYALLRGSKQ